MAAPSARDFSLAQTTSSTTILEPAAVSKPQSEFPDDGVDLDRLLADYERDIVLAALKKSGGLRKEAARLLGITFRSLRYRLEKLGIDDAGPEAAALVEEV